MRIHLKTGPGIAVPVFLLALSIDLAQSLLFPSEHVPKEGARTVAAEDTRDHIRRDHIALQLSALDGLADAESQLWRLAIIVCDATGTGPAD